MSSVAAWILIPLVMIGALVVNGVVYFRRVAANDAERKYRAALADDDARSGAIESPITGESDHT